MRAYKTPENEREKKKSILMDFNGEKCKFKC